MRNIFIVYLISEMRYSTNKTGCHDITEILLKVALNTITQNLTPEIRNFAVKLLDAQ